MHIKKFVRGIRKRLKGPRCSHEQASNFLVQEKTEVVRCYKNQYTVAQAADLLKQMYYANPAKR